MKNTVNKSARHVLLSCLLASITALHAQNPLPADKVLARNSRTSVTYGEFEAELARSPQKDRFELLLNRDKIGMLVENLLVNKTLAVEARDNKLDASPLVQAEIANQTTKVLAKYRGQQYQANLPKIDLLPRARERYLTEPENVTTQELHEVWHVLVSNKGRTPEQAQARAEEVRKKLLAGESTEKLAREYSDDPSNDLNQGRLGARKLKEFDARFAKTVKDMKVGDVAITESSFGVHVVKLLDFTPSTRFTFEAAKPFLLQEAETEYIVSSWNNYLRNLSNDPKLVVDVEALEALRPKLPEIPPVPPAAAADAAKVTPVVDKK